MDNSCNEVFAMFVIWNKKTIERLSDVEKQQWFDVLNYRLEEDRGISLDDPELIIKQKEIKDDYIKYLESCPKQDNFFKYYVLYDNHKMVSVCRINIYNQRYLLEGLQTHRDQFRNGYATQLIDGMIYDLNKEGIDTLYSEARVWNVASNQLQLQLGFTKYGEDKYNNLYQLNIDSYIRRQLFNRWSTQYHKSVSESESKGTYPFAGYSQVKYHLIELITKHQKKAILDMGVGTGEIMLPLYRLGYHITGVDLSENMLKIAKNSMPDALFIQGEFEDAIPQLKQKYDVIVFSYAIHHLTYKKQIDLLTQLNSLLNQDGFILIADVSGENPQEMNALKERYEDIWDDEEFYPMNDIYQNSDLSHNYAILYVQINEVAGIYKLNKK